MNIKLSALLLLVSPSLSQSMNLFNNNNTQNRQTTPLFVPNSQNQNASQSQPQNLSSQPQVQPQTTNLSQIQQRPNELLNQVPQRTEKQKPLLFKQIWKIIEREPQKLMRVLQKQAVKEALRVSLEYFDKSADKKQRYQKQHAKAQNFGFGVRQMGQQCKKFKCDTISYLWKCLIQHVSLLCNVNQLLLCGYLSNYLASNSIYTNALTVKQFYCGNYIRASNKSFIQCLLTTNFQTKQRIVSMQNQFFLQIIEYLFNEVYFQHLAMLRIINFLQKKEKKYFRQVVKKGTSDYFTVLWKKLKNFSVLGIKQQLEADNPSAKKIKQFFLSTKKYGIQRKLWRHKISVRMAIGGSLVLGLSQYGSWIKQPLVNTLIDYKQAIKFIDSDLQALVTQRAQLPTKQYNYARNNLQILLQVIPMSSFSKKPQQRPAFIKQGRQMQILYTSIKQTRSLYLQSFRFLVWVLPFMQIAKNQINQNFHHNNLKIQQKWMAVPQNVTWMMRNHQWRQWLGNVLGAFQNYKGLSQIEQLLLQIIKMSKTVIQAHIDQFWSDQPRYDLQQIKTYLLSCVNDKGIRPFLPIFTKCLGSNYNKFQYTGFTLKLLGFEVIKSQIRDNIMQNLNITDKSYSSMNLSMFYQQNNNQNSNDYAQSIQPVRNLQAYPEQQLKFLCRVVENSKENLSMIECFLFQCQDDDSTGILVCKFLFQCLSKLRDYRAPALKCMRYIINAIDALFVYIYTRQPLMISMSLNFSQQWGQHGRNQLYDMVSFICTKQSVSEQYRQSQKLKQCISHHICNITRKSKYLSEYFPIKQDLRDERLFIQLNTLITHKNYSGIGTWYRENSNHIEYRVTQWYTTLLLTLQGSDLLPIDLQTIRLLMQKMQVDKNWQHQYNRMSSMVQILNKCPIIQTILHILQPRLCSKNGQKNQFKSILGISNYKLIQFVDINSIEANQIYKYNYRQDQSFEKSQEKRRIRYKKQKQTIVGSIAGSLELMYLILSMYNSICKFPDTYSTKYQLVQKLNIYKQVKQSLTNTNKIFHYQIPVTKNRYMTKQSLTVVIDNSNDNDRVLQMQDSGIVVNLIQVIASYVNFQKYFFLPFQPHYNKCYKEEDLVIDNYALEDLVQQDTQIFVFNNILTFDQNQLTLQTDYTIGIGTTLRLLNQLILQQNGCALLYKCITNHNYMLASQTANSNSMLQNRHKFTVLVRQCIRMLDQNSSNEQLQVIFQFLTIGLNQSYYFVQEILHNQPLIALRRSIKEILQTCDTETDLIIINQIGLFVLAVLQYKDTHPDQVNMFVKLPTSIIQDIMKVLASMQDSMQRLFRIRQPQPELIFSNVEYYKKMSTLILYKGCIHICMEALKRYYIQQSAQQNIEFMHYVCKLMYFILEIPAKPDTNYVKLYKLQQKNSIVINSNEQICLIDNQNVIMYRQKYKFKSLATFIGYLPSLHMQYGRNYQFNVNHLFSRAIYSLFKIKSQINKLVMAAYQVNYKASLQNCHQEMVSSIMSFLVMACTTGQYGHLLCIRSEDKINNSYIIHPHGPALSQKYIKSATLQVRDLYKYRKIQNTGIKNIFGYNSQQSLSTKLSLIQTLRQYFEKDHQKQYTNDIVLYTMSVLLNSLAQYWKLGVIFVGAARNILTFVLDCTLLNFRVSPKIYTILLDSIVRCALCCTEMTSRNVELIQKICQILENILVYGRNVIDTSIINVSGSNQTIYNEYTIQQNIFLICGIIIKIINGAPIYTQSLYSNTQDNQNMIYLSQTKNLIAHITKTIVQKYLINFQTIDLTNMMIMKLINTLINNFATERGTDNTDRHYQQFTNMMMDIAAKYIKYLVRAMESKANCSLFGSFLIEGLIVLHQCQALRDGGTSALLMEYMSTQFDTNLIRGLQINTNTTNSKQKQDIIRLNYNTYNNTATKSKPKRLSQQNYYFQKLINRKSLQQNSLSLSQIVEGKQIFNLLFSICSQQFYWTNKKHSFIVQSIFNSLINQNFIYQLVDTCRQSANRLLQTRIPVQNQSQDKLMKVQVDQLQKQPNKIQFEEQIYPRLRLKQKDRTGPLPTSQGKKTTLFQFCVHVQICHNIFDFLTTLNECLQKSESLKRFFNKILNNGLNHIDQFVWQKITNTLQCIMNFLNEIAISYVRYYPKSLCKILPMYILIKNNTDFGYDTDFLNVYFGDAGLSGYAQSDLQQQYRNFIMDLILIFCNCSIKFIQIWKANDWKSSVNWHQSRSKLAVQVFQLFKNATNYIITGIYEQEEAQNLRKLFDWFDANRIS